PLAKQCCVTSTVPTPCRLPPRCPYSTLFRSVVDTGQGVQTFEIAATKNGRRLEVTTARGVVEVSEATRGGTPVRTGVPQRVTSEDRKSTRLKSSHQIISYDVISLKKQKKTLN